MKKIILLLFVFLPFPIFAYTTIVPPYNSYSGIGSSPYNPIYIDVAPTKETENNNKIERLKSQYGLTNYYDCYSQNCKSMADLGDPYKMGSCLTYIEYCLERKQMKKETQCSSGYVFYNNRCVTYDTGCKEKYGQFSSYTNTLDSQGKMVCDCQSGYEWKGEICVKKENTCPSSTININGSCITYTQQCNNYYGTNTYGAIGTNGTLNCFCNSGYEWNAERTNCTIINKAEATLLMDVDDICQKNHGSNSYWSGESVINNVVPCLCNSGYSVDKNNQCVLNENITATNNISEEKKIDKKLVNRLKGQILLQVENHGEAWYLDPSTEKRYYMKDGQAAYEMLRKFGLGITDADLQKIPAENSEDKGNIAFTNKVKGKILLQVQQHGEAWYVNPKDGKRYYLKNGDEAYRIMRILGLGITNKNLDGIPIEAI